MSTLLIAGGQLVDEQAVRRADVLVRDGRVAKVLQPGHHQVVDDVLDAEGMHILPGGVDVHVRFNEPGRTDVRGTPVRQAGTSRVEPGFGQLVRV